MDKSKRLADGMRATRNVLLEIEAVTESTGKPMRVDIGNDEVLLALQIIRGMGYIDIMTVGHTVAECRVTDRGREFIKGSTIH